VTNGGHIMMVDRYILEVVFKEQFECFVDEFDKTQDIFELCWQESAEEDIYLYLKYLESIS